MDRTKLQEMVEQKRLEQMKKLEERTKKIRDKAEVDIKKAEEKAASVELDEGKLIEAAEIDEQMKVLQERKKALGLGRTIGVAKGPRPKSVSGKYPSVRAYAEYMFAEDPEIKGDEFVANIHAEFPESRATKSDYNWLKNKILVEGEWKTRS